MYKIGNRGKKNHFDKKFQKKGKMNNYLIGGASSHMLNQSNFSLKKKTEHWTG